MSLLHADEGLHVRFGNATPCKKVFWECCTWFFPPCMPLKMCLNTAEVPSGSVRTMEDGRGGFDFLGHGGDKQGIHLYWSCFYRIGDLVSINETTAKGGRVVSNGSEWIVIVPQARKCGSHHCTCLKRSLLRSI